MPFFASPRFWSILAASIWAVWWALLASAFVFKHDYDALWALGIFSMPSSLIVDELSHAISNGLDFTKEDQLFVDLGGFLVFGSAQYSGIGYFFGKAVRWIYARQWRK